MQLHCCLSEIKNLNIDITSIKKLLFFKVYRVSMLTDS